MRNTGRFAIRTAAAVAVSLLGLGPAPARGDDRPTLSGRWSASAMRVVWNVGDWGAACGPKPSGGGAPAGSVTIAAQGSELSFSGAGRSYSTAQCWEEYPGLKRTSHSGGARGWRSSCATAAGDPRQATIVTTLGATDDYITFDETGQYQFVINGQNCTASVRRSRSYRLLQREGETPPPASTAAASTAAPSAPAPKPEPPAKLTPPANARCDTPGAPARLEVRPSKKLMHPGERFTFRAAVLDASGCALAVAPSWRVTRGSEYIKLGANGAVEALGSADDTQSEIAVAVEGRTTKVLVEIASKERYDALLRGGGFDADGESTEVAVAVIVEGSVGARSAHTDEAAERQKRMLLALGGASVFALGALGLWLALRRKRPALLEDASETAPLATTTLSGAPIAGHEPRASSALVCPTCREELPAGSIFCPNDGNRLLPIEDPDARAPGGGMCPVCGQGYDPGVAVCPEHDEELIPVAAYRSLRDALPRHERKICPMCGTAYGGEAEFCGKDGAVLVPIN